MLKVFGQHDENTIKQMQNCVDAGAVKGVLCADGHLGYSQPVGGVVAYKGKVSVSGVGYDIACGNMAALTDLTLKDVEGKMDTIMDAVVKRVSFGIGRANQERVEHPLFEHPVWTWLEKMKAPHPERPDRIMSFSKRKAEEQLGTVGSGNHYVDIFADEDDRIWVGVHFGSRGLGHSIATAFLWLGGGTDGIYNAPTLLDEGRELAQMYLSAMDLAGQYAYAGREWVTRTVATEILGGKILDEVHNHHNFAWKESHVINGETINDLWVVRKGATPAFAGQRGFVGGSMGDNAVIIEGVESESSKDSLYSTVHGAGRVMSRTAAIGKFVRDENGKKQRQPGLVRHDEMMKWLHDKGVVLRGSDLDEAPQAYRRLPDVLKEHDGTIRILHTLRPLGVAMAGKDIVDPYKD